MKAIYKLKFTPLETKNVKTKKLIMAITSLPKQAKKLRGKGKRYENTLIELLKIDYYDDDLALPTGKELYERSGITQGMFRKHLEEIFEDLYAMIWDFNNITIDIKDVEYLFYVSTQWNGNFAFRCKLPKCPREGEYVGLPVMEHYLGGYLYYVDKVTHKIENDMQVVELWINEGVYNPYYKMKRAERTYRNNINSYKEMYKDVYH